jgi:hypothetical protein
MEIRPRPGTTGDASRQWGAPEAGCPARGMAERSKQLMLFWAPDRRCIRATMWRMPGGRLDLDSVQRNLPDVLMQALACELSCRP